MAVMNPPIAVSGATTHNADDLRAALASAFLPQGLYQANRPRAGILPGWGGELQVTQTATPGMRVRVRPGVIMIPAPQDGHGGWLLVNDADLELTLAQAHQTSPRTDLVIARVADTQYTAGGDNLASIRIITGTAGAGAPVPTPNATEGAYIVLGRIAVAAAASSITDPNITQNLSNTRPYTVAHGGILPVANAAARTALAAYNGQHVFQLDSGQVWIFLDGTWRPQAVGRVGDIERAGWNASVYMNNGQGQQLTSYHTRYGIYSVRGGYLTGSQYGVHGDGTQVYSNSSSITIPLPPMYGVGEYADSGRGEPLGEWYYSALESGAVFYQGGPLLFNPATGRADLYNWDGTRHADTWTYTKGLKARIAYYVD